jgi:ureidoglycolate lyase
MAGEMRFLDLELMDATPESVARFGALLGTDCGAGSRQTAFYDDAVSLFETPRFVSDADTTLSVARIRPRPNSVRWMERHFKHSQAFLPLNGQPYAVVLAPPNDGGLPDLDRVRALRFPGHSGLLMHIGTWHEFPFSLGSPVDMVIVLRNETNRNLDAIENGEAIGEDLEKRNILTRCGVTIRFATRG